MIKIVSFVDSFKHFEQAIDEYLKRMNKQVSSIKLKPVNKGDYKEIIRSESNILKDFLSKTKAYKVLLYIDSRQFSSIDFATFINKNTDLYGDIIFVIGGSFGVDLKIIEDQIDFKLSLSSMTFPHIMANLVLLEQIYRRISITKGTSYHH